MSLNIPDFYDGQTDYITKFNTAFSDIESLVNALEQDLATIQASITPGTLNDLRNALINYVDNGGMDIWQRGPGPFWGLNNYGPDRWYIDTDNGIILSKAEIDHSESHVTRFALRTYGQGVIAQRISNHICASLKDIVVKFGGWVKTDTANVARLGVFNGLTNQWTSYHTGSGEWEFLSSSFAVANPLAELSFKLQCIGDVLAYWSGMSLVRSNPNTLIYVPKLYSQEMQECQAYYEIGIIDIGGVGYLDIDGKRKLDTHVQYNTRKKNVVTLDVDIETGDISYNILSNTNEGFTIQFVQDADPLLQGFNLQDVLWIAISLEDEPWYT